MRFGTKKSEAVNEEFDGEFKPYLRNFREGDNVVRFIEEVDDWIGFSEHYVGGKSFPCTNDRKTCPGCTDEDERVRKATRKYATNLKLVTNDKVLPFRIPMSLAKKLFNRAERNGTITNRDYIVMREGKGLDTEYDLEQDDKRPENMDVLRAESHDIEAVLVSSYDEIWGKVDEPKQEEKPPFDASEEVDEETLRKMDRNELIGLAKHHDIIVDVDGSKGEILTSILEAAG